MKLPVSWLAEYIDISDLSVQELADRITFAGIEIASARSSTARRTSRSSAAPPTAAPAS